MNLEQKYYEFYNQRGKGTNTQIKFFSNFFENSEVKDLEGYIKKNWNPIIWDILENILKGGKVDEELRMELKSWYIEDRTLEEYLVKVFLAWFTEDCLYNWLNSQSWVTSRYSVHKGGTDAKRELVSANRATGAPDLYVKSLKDGKLILLEVSSDNTSYTMRTGLHDLRHRKNGMSKYEELQSRRKDAEVDRVFLLIIDAVYMNAAFLEMDDEIEPIREYENSYYGDRMCTELSVSKELKRWKMKLK